MTYRDAMLLLIDKTDRAVEAAKVLQSIDANSPLAKSRAEKLIRVAIGEGSRLTATDKAALSSLIPNIPADAERRTETVRFRCTPSERAALQLLADRYARGNLSQLIIDALNDKYPTL